MPGKGRRVASRQAQLGRRRKRQSRGAGGAPTAEPEIKTAPKSTADSVATEVKEPATPHQEVRAQGSPHSVAASPQTRPARARADLGLAYNYVMPELRRIGIFSGILLAVLIVLAFFL
jgi:hypothetical protein